MISGDSIEMNNQDKNDEELGQETGGKSDPLDFFGENSPPLLEEYDNEKTLTSILSNIITTPDSNDSRQFFHQVFCYN